MVKVAGVDEAGRGPAIGPLVMGGVLFDEEAAELLPSMGVRDSKKLSPRRRESLEAEIMDLADRWAFFSLPYDHLLHTDELTTVDRYLGPTFGVEHRPLVVEVGAAA